MSPLVIGLTLMGFGTSIPELVTSAQAALAGAPGIAVGNAVGSNIINILLILGLTALFWPVRLSASSLPRSSWCRGRCRWQPVWACRRRRTA